MAPYQRATDVQLRAALLEMHLKGWMCKGVFCSSSIFMSFGCCLFQLLPAEGIYVNVPNTLSPLFVAIKGTQLGSRAGTGQAGIQNQVLSLGPRQPMLRTLARAFPCAQQPLRWGEVCFTKYLHRFLCARPASVTRRS